jgi:hypothetical protein
MEFTRAPAFIWSGPIGGRFYPLARNLLSYCYTIMGYHGFSTMAVFPYGPPFIP